MAKPSNISSRKGAENIKSIIKGKLIQSQAKKNNILGGPLVERRGDKVDGSMTSRKSDICSEFTGSEKVYKKLNSSRDTLELGLKVKEHEKIQRNLDSSEDELELNPSFQSLQKQGEIFEKFLIQREDLKPPDLPPIPRDLIPSPPSCLKDQHIKINIPSEIERLLKIKSSLATSKFQFTATLDSAKEN